MSVTFNLLLAALLPLAGFLLLIFFGRRIGRYAGVLSTALLAGSLTLSIGALILWVDKAGFNQPHYVEAFTYHWITLPSATPLDPFAPAQQAPAITLGILVDSLTVALFLLVTFLVGLVHVFSLGFMAADPKAPRYFALLNLLSFSMLGLILANSLIQLFAFWQLLGIAAWLLIHYRSDRRAPVIASLRCFIFNRIGDAAFLTGIGILLFHTGPSGISSLSFFDAEGLPVLNRAIGDALGVRSSEFLYFTTGLHTFLGLHWLTWAGIAFLIAILVRTAQFPFQSWLAGTAEAPTPIAALLQAAILPVSGVYLLARLYPLLTLDARLIVAIVGCGSLFLAALIACVQTDIRKILAWSTVSQFGFVLLFLGAGGYMAGLLHLFTHAFFKTGLLLAAGSVLYALQGESDLRQMGGLWKRLPVTAAASLVAVLALAGMPWLSGSYSANLGLACVYEYAKALEGPPSASLGTFAPGMLLFWLPVSAVFLTAFAIGRWWWLIFIAPAPATPRTEKLLEEARDYALLTLPTILLAGFSVGFLFEFFGLLQFIKKSLPPAAAAFAFQVSPDDPAFKMVAIVTAVAPAALAFAFLVYLRGFSLADRLRRIPGVNLLHYYLRERLFLDTFSDFFATLALLVSRLVLFIDRFILSFVFRLFAFVIEVLSHLAARVDLALDRPVRTLALLLAPRFHKLLPKPPAPPAPPSAPQ